MTHERLEEPAWGQFCEVVSQMLASHTIDFEIVAPAVGDQPAGRSLDLIGLSYDAAGDTLHVSARAQGGRPLAHGIRSPRDMYAELGDTGVAQIVVIDARERKHLMRLREPSALLAVMA